jgi:hypothetical protein
MDGSNEIEVTVIIPEPYLVLRLLIYEADAASMSALTLHFFKPAEMRSHPTPRESD